MRISKNDCRLIVAIPVLVTLTANLATAQDRPAPVAEASVGWVGFADDGIVSESFVGLAARWYLSPRVSVGPEIAYVHGRNHSHLTVTGNVMVDMLSSSSGVRRRVTPFVVA
jgi:hypothetical protein